MNSIHNLSLIHIFAAAVQVKLHCLGYIGSRGICYRFVVDAVRDPGVIQRPFQAAGQAQLPDAGICDEQDFAAAFLLNDLRRAFTLPTILGFR